MSKPIKCNKSLKKGKCKSSSSESNSTETSDRPEKNKTKKESIRKPKKLINIDSVGKSKQLSEKLKTTKTRTQSSGKKPSNESRICGNGKVMPSLSELEQMFADSDDDTPTCGTITERCKTPVQPICVDTPKLNISPSTIKVISNKMLDLITNLPDPSIFMNENQPSLPVVPPKKRKKPEEPYIVGCKDRRQIIKKSNVVIGKVDEDYGVDYSDINQDDDDHCPKKRKKRTAAGSASLSKSIFNPKSEEIAAMLREQEKSDNQSDSSVDSNKTVAYDCNSLSPYHKPRSFSPLPSTSKDNDTFLKNDLRFNESLLGDNLTNDSSHSDVEVVEVVELPCETIIVDDECLQTNEVIQTNSCKEDLTKDVEEITFKLPSPPTFDAFEDDLYSSIVIDVDQTYCNDDCEIIDVDDVIAENKNIIDKYQKASEVNTVTHVQPSISRSPTTNEIENKISDAVKKSSENLSNKDDSIECVVTDFFRGQPPRGTTTPNRNSSIETVDLSNSGRKENLIDLNNFVKTITKYLNLLTKQTCTGTRNRAVIDTINLDESTHSDNDSVTFVSSSHPNSTNNNNQTRNVQNCPNNSVLLNNSVIPVVNTTPNIAPCKNRKYKKTKSANEPLAPTLTTTNQSTPIRRIGDCPICMDNLSNTTVASTICGHIFCMPCIQSAIKASGKKCPTCRKALKGVGYHQLFL